MTLELPRPRNTRWQPLRSGLLNLYRFDHEELWYEDGHLLLRGNNGTGKSRILALQLPFLLDGEVAPHRMEPDGDPAKRAEWNLLMGRYDDRLGYSWIEFGRRDPDPTEEGDSGERYLTLGCGLSAVKGRGAPDRWYFVTGQRVGVDLFLAGSAGEPLTRPRLAEALGDRGEVYTTAGQYRDAVDKALFRLGSQRYEALVDLLIQLRQPQLSRKLDEARLSRALSDALPPLDEQILADVAEAFRALENDRAALADLKRAGEAVDEFLTGYRRYGRIAARRRAEGVRLTHSAYETSQRRMRSAQDEHDSAQRRLAETDQELEHLDNEHTEAETTLQTLEKSPEMRDKQALDVARQRAEEHRAETRRASEELERAAAGTRRGEEQLTQANATAEHCEQETRTRLDETRRLALPAALETDHLQHAETLEPLDELTPERLEQAARGLAALAERRIRGARHLRHLDAAVQRTRRELKHAKERQAERTAELDEAREEHRRADTAVTATREALLSAYGTWRDTLQELSPPTPGELTEALEEWSRQPEGESPVAAAARQARNTADLALLGRKSELDTRRAEAQEELAGWRQERSELRAGAHRPPPAPHTRDEASRDERPGAPLWRVCDFAPELPDTERAGLEAALEAAGLLDAWLTPDGRLLEPGSHDTVLVAGSNRPAPDGQGLGRALRPDLDPADARLGGLQAETVATVLAHVGLGAGTGEVWVDVDGRYQLGPRHGIWAKARAQHLGQGAREADRQRRLLEIEQQIADGEALLAALERQAQTLAQRQRRVQQELESAPGDDAVRRADAALGAAAEQEERARTRLVRAEEQVTERRREHDNTRAELTEAAAGLGLADHLGALEALEDGAVAYGQALAALRPTALRSLETRATAETLRRRLEEARADEDRWHQRHDQARQRQLASDTARDTLERTVGAGVQEILDRLETTRARLATVGDRSREARQRREALLEERARSAQVIANEAQNLEREATARGRAVTRLARLVTSGLVAVGLPDLEAREDHRANDREENREDGREGRSVALGDPAEWSASRAVEIARRMEERLSRQSHGDDAWERSQGDVHRRYKTMEDVLLGHGHRSQLELDDDLFVVTAHFQGQQQTLDRFRTSLGAETEARDRLLAEKERSAIENHLLGDVALHLHQRLRDAEELVQTMNRQIESRPTSTGMALRFRWQPQTDEVPLLLEARNLLMSERGVWSPGERESVGEFLQSRIKAEQQEDEAGSWQQHLARALDYRAWHRFSIERQQEGQWRRLTRRTHGTGSGGEKAIALTIPQFAAAAAHYDTADPCCPRLILLDEAFVGVDADMRAKCMGLLQDFDLDFLMTSEREWGCYPSLPGLAICQLATRPGIDAVGVTRWLWNGSERHRAEHHPTSASEPRPAEAPLFEGLG